MLKVPRRLMTRHVTSTNPDEKFNEEIAFWKREIDNYLKWYTGEIDSFYGHPAPSEKEKVKTPKLEHSAILTWLELHQKPKYLVDLAVDKKAFSGLKVLDIGAGPMPSGLVFEKVKLYCLDPLVGRYLSAGFPIHYYDDAKFINASSEDMPFDDNYFDVVVSVNAIDHVDDLNKTSREIQRVLKPGGKLALHVHYHQPTDTEPLVINDRVLKRCFKWAKNFKKVSASQQEYRSNVPKGQQYALWRNF